MAAKISIKAMAKKYAFLIPATVLFAIAVNMLYLPNDIVVGGFSGIGILAEKLFGFRVSVVTLILNIPLLIIAWKVLGKHYVADALAATILFSAMVEIFAFVPKIKDDYLLAAVFGGILDGTGVGLVLRAKATSGGTDLLAILLHKLKRNVSVSTILFVVNTAIIILGVYAFGLNKGMYAVISTFISTKMISFVTSGPVSSKVAFIVSDKSNEIANEVMKSLNRGVTFIKGEGAYTGSEKKVMLCVFSQKEIVTLGDIVKKTDSQSFMIITDARLVMGAGFKDIETDDIV